MATKTTALASSTALPQSEAAKKRLILIVNSKGGVGKSVVARALADLYRNNGVKVRIYDADGAVGSLAASYGERGPDNRLLVPQNPETGIGQYDIRHEDSRATLLNSLDKAPDLVMHDLAGGSLNELKRIVDAGEGVQYLADTISDLGYRITLVHVISNVSGATASVKEYAQAFGNKADHVVVINKAWGSADEDFPFWFGYTTPETTDADGNKVPGKQIGGKTRRELVEDGTYGSLATEIRFPALQSGTFAKVEASNMTYTDAKDSQELTITERAHVARFVRASTDAFLAAKDKLGL